jgi:uncharacterized membrane protein
LAVALYAPSLALSQALSLPTIVSIFITALISAIYLLTVSFCEICLTIVLRLGGSTSGYSHIRVANGTDHIFLIGHLRRINGILGREHAVEKRGEGLAFRPE